MQRFYHTQVHFPEICKTNTLSVLPFGARIVAQGIVPVNVGREKTGNT